METETETFNRVKDILKRLGLEITKEDTSRPWGGFYVINENQSQRFIEQFFPDEDPASLSLSGKLSPKILMVAPDKRLSWQYHYRRAEIWRCVEGPVEVASSDTDEEINQYTLREGDKICLHQGQRHRLIGLNTWGVIAEIWRHTDAQNPSNEDDIVRIQDDFGR